MESFDAVLTVLPIHIQGIMTRSQVCISLVCTKASNTISGVTHIPISQDYPGSPSTYYEKHRLVP